MVWFLAFSRLRTLLVILLATVALVQSVRGTALSSLDYQGDSDVFNPLVLLQAVINGGVPPVSVRWAISNGTVFGGDNITFNRGFGIVLYGVCLIATDATGSSVVGGHLLKAALYDEGVYHAHHYSPIDPGITVAPNCPIAGETVSFSTFIGCAAGANCAPPPWSGQWLFGDGSSTNFVTSDRTNVSLHSYSEPGIYFAQIRARDSLGRTNTNTVPVVVIDLPPKPVIGPYHQDYNGNASFLVPRVPVRFDGSSSYDPDGTITNYTWTFSDGAQQQGPVVYHGFPKPGSYAVRLTVTDNAGLRASVSTVVRVAPSP